MADPQSARSVRLRDRPHWRDVVTALPASVVLAVTLAAFLQGTEVEEPEMVLLVIAVLGVLPLVNGYFLVRGAIVVELDHHGIRLFKQSVRFLHRRRESPEFDLPWSEVKRLVLWHRTFTRRDSSYSVTMLGIGSPTPIDRDDETEVSGLLLGPKRIPLFDVVNAGDPRDGFPAHIPDATLFRSVGFSAGGARALATAVARFAPNVPVIDARNAGRSRRVETSGKGPRVR